MTRLVGTALCAALLIPATALGQGIRFTVGATAAQEIVQSHIGDASNRFTGLIVGAEGNLVSDRFVMLLRYGQGRVSDKADTGLASRDVVEGEALFGVRATPWLTLWAGPSARAYTTSEGDQRWLLWSGRATARGTIIPGRMQSFVELWGALSGSVGNPSMKAGGRGADAGLEVRLAAEKPFWGRLGYRIDSGHADGLRETVEAVTLTLFYGFPQ